MFEIEAWTAGDGGFDLQQQQLAPVGERIENGLENTRKSSSRNRRRTRKSDKGGGDNLNCTKTLSREVISRYFYMPITKAARELNVGLTQLKKRCRQLGIRRWPHRKLMSLQTLINNVQAPTYFHNLDSSHFSQNVLWYWPLISN